MLRLDDEVRLHIISTNPSQIVDMRVSFGKELMRLYLFTSQPFYPPKWRVFLTLFLRVEVEGSL